MNIFIGRLDKDTTDKDIYHLFKEYGYVNTCFVIKDKITKVSRGHGYVVMKNDDEAMAAISALNGYVLNGEEMMVKPAKPGEIKYIRIDN